MSAQPGSRLGPYEVLGLVGAGGMGDVYRARDTRLDRTVALKLLRADPSTSRWRFVREAKAAASLNDPHIVAIYDIGTEGGRDFIAMEFVSGRTLDQVIGPTGMRPRDTLDIGIQIATGLAKAHEAGITHRDLKPGNIIVTDSGTVKILDFGLAKLREPAFAPEDEETRSLAPRTVKGTIVGTVAYMSPEQADGRPTDARSDIFSFGSILYEMAAGRRAFQGESILATLSAVLEKEPAPLPEAVPNDLKKVILRSLRKDPEQRYQHVSDVRIALEELRQEAHSQRVPVAVRDAHSRRRRWGTAALATALIAAALWVASRRTEPAASVPLVAVPLTSDAGLEEDPNFSPSGDQVAYAWKGEAHHDYDIYVKMVGSPKPLRLTTDPADDRHPVFSPDGRSIGFIRTSAGRRTYVVTSAIGGSERLVAQLPDSAAESTTSGPPSLSSAWLPDGKSVVLDGLKLLSLETGEVTDVIGGTGPIIGSFPTVAPGGRTLAFTRPAGLAASAIHLLGLSKDGTPAGEPRQLAVVAGDIFGVTWTSDGTGLVFANGNLTGSSGLAKTLWRISAVEGAAPERLPLGEDVTAPTISPRAGRLAFVRNAWDANIWRATLPDGGAAPAAPAKFLSSTRSDWNPQYSPDGSRILFESLRTGQSAIWMSNADGSNTVELFSRPGKHSGTPRWAPDGQQLAFDSSAEGDFDIYVIRPGSRQPRRLTHDPGDDVMPAWSPDGQWIYFASSRTGRSEVWKVPAGGGQAMQVTRSGGLCVFPSPGGSTIYYTKQDGDVPLWSMSIAGGPEIQVLPSIVERNVAVFGDGIYFVPRGSADGSRGVHYLDLGTGAVTPVVPIPGRVSIALAVSPDRRELLYVQIDGMGRDLMLVEGFR